MKDRLTRSIAALRKALFAGVRRDTDSWLWVAVAVEAVEPLAGVAAPDGAALGAVVEVVGTGTAGIV